MIDIPVEQITGLVTSGKRALDALAAECSALRTDGAAKIHDNPAALEVRLRSPGVLGCNLWVQDGRSWLILAGERIRVFDVTGAGVNPTAVKLLSGE